MCVGHGARPRGLTAKLKTARGVSVTGHVGLSSSREHAATLLIFFFLPPPLLWPQLRLHRAGTVAVSNLSPSVRGSAVRPYVLPRAAAQHAPLLEGPVEKSGSQAGSGRIDGTPPISSALSGYEGMRAW